MDSRQNSWTRREGAEAERSIRPEEAMDEEPRIHSQRLGRRETTSSPASPDTSRNRPLRQGLRRMLASRRSIRQAIILNEIIGPPKALQQKK